MPSSDYFEIAAAEARAARTRVPVTHWQRADAPRYGHRMQRAVCGELVADAHITPEPTCPLCQQWMREDDAALASLL